MDNLCCCGNPKSHNQHEVCDGCYNETMLMMAELEMEDANQAFDEAYPVEHWADMASFGDNGFE